MSATSSQLSPFAAEEGKPLRYIIQNLERAYGVPENKWTDWVPLDMLVFRILRRVGLVPEKCADARGHELMTALVPAGKFYSFHVNLIRHGRALCRPRDPLCEQCPIVEYCDYGQTLAAGSFSY